MGIKSGSRAFFKDAPDDALDSIDIPTIDVSEELEGSFDYIHLFALSGKIMNHEFPLLKKAFRLLGNDPLLEGNHPSLPGSDRPSLGASVPYLQHRLFCA